MGNVNELQEREANSKDGVDSSSSEEDSSSSSIAISEQELLDFSECLHFQAIETNGEFSRDQSISPLLHTGTSIGAADNDSDNAVELSIDSTRDDSFPLSESAIPESFEILEAFSPVPSDTSEAFHTPDLSQSDVDDNEASKQLNLPFCTVQAEREQEQREKPQQQTVAELNECGASTEPVEIVLLVPEIENLDRRSEADLDSIGQPSPKTLTDIAPVEDYCMPRAPTPSDSECKENPTIELERLDTSSNRTSSLPVAELLESLSLEIQTPVLVQAQDLPWELQIEVSMGGSPVVELHVRQNNPPSCGSTNTPELAADLADELPRMAPPETLSKVSDGRSETSLSTNARLDKRPLEIQDPVPLAETPPILSEAVSTSLATSPATPSKVQEHAYVAPVKQLTDAPIVPVPIPIAASPPRHTADRPNWALAPDSPPKPKIASPKKRRKRARGGKQVNTDSVARNVDSLRSSSQEGGVDTTKSRLKSEQPPHESSGTSTKATKIVASTYESSSHREVLRTSTASSSVSASIPRNEPISNVNEGYQKLLSTVHLAEDVARCHERDASAFLVAPAAAGSPHKREGPEADAFALPAPILMQTIAALEQNINQHENLKADVNRISIKDEAVNLCYLASSKSDQPEGSRDCTPVNSAITMKLGNIKRDTSSISMQFNQSDDLGRFFGPLTLSSVDISDQSSPYRSPSGRGTSVLPTITEGCPIQGKWGKAIDLRTSYQVSPKSDLQHGVNDVASLKSSGKRITVVSDSQKPNENLAPNASSSFLVMPMASRQYKRLSWPALKDDLRYGSTARPLLLHSDSETVGPVFPGLSPGSASLSITAEAENPTPHSPLIGYSDGLVAATGSQHVAFDESVAARGETPTARVNLPTKRSQSLDSDPVHEGNGHGHRSPFQSGIPVLTKKYVSKDITLNAGRGPILLPRSIRSLYAQGGRVSPRLSAQGSSSQNTCHTSGFTQTKRAAPHPYTRHPEIVTAARSRSAFAVNQNMSSGPENRSRSLESIPIEHIRGTHINTAAPIYLYPSGSSQSQVPVHHQYSTVYRTRYEDLQGNPQPGEFISLDQLQNTGYTAEFVRETSILHVPPLHRPQHGSFHRAPDDPSTLN